MSDSNRNTSNGAVEQIMRNISSDVQNLDGQYIQLGFPSPTVPPWNLPNQLSQATFMPSYNVLGAEQNVPYPLEHQFAPEQVSYNYLPQTPIYNHETFDKPINNDVSYNYTTNGVQDMFSTDYKLFMSQNYHHKPETPKENMMIFNNTLNHNSYIQNPQENVILPNNPNRNLLIDNLVGNWVPNTSGTYTPFGNVPSYQKENIFGAPQTSEKIHPMMRQASESKITECDRIEDTTFSFNRDSKKPRMIAEVKPMRPSYSDVVLKSAPQTNNKVSNKNETKEVKQKKEARKNIKAEKFQRFSNILKSSNASNESKEVGNDKNASFNKVYEKGSKEMKSSNLNRKWASLDNVTDNSQDFKVDASDLKRHKKPVEVNNKSNVKINQRKVGKSDFSENDSSGYKVDTNVINKSVSKKGVKLSTKQRLSDSGFGGNERSLGKRSQRSRKRDNQVPFAIVGQKLKKYCGWWKYIMQFLVWLFHLVVDILCLSVHLSKDVGTYTYSWIIIHWDLFLETSTALIKRVKFFTWIYEKFKKTEEPEVKPNFLHTGLQNNINMPTTGEDAMKRLLACKDKDPYSILGVTPTCTDSDIKNYYKKQAKLVHPDKNQQPGAEEAFKILVHAFDMIGEPERRAAYDRGVAESAQAEQAMSELTKLLVQLQQKVEAAANTIRCSACGLRHKRIKVDRPCYAARNCVTCKIHHAAREGDIWAEAKCFGFLWYYYACMDGGVYDITEWAGCQKDSLKHLRPDSHNVQYRIALGKQNNGPPKKHASPLRTNKNDDLDNLFNSFYGQTDNAQNLKRKSRKSK